MAKSIGEKIIEKMAMNFVNEVSRRATKAFLDRGEKEVRKRADSKKAARLDNASIEEEEIIE